MMFSFAFKRSTKCPWECAIDIPLVLFFVIVIVFVSVERVNAKEQPCNTDFDRTKSLKFSDLVEIIMCIYVYCARISADFHHKKPYSHGTHIYTQTLDCNASYVFQQYSNVELFVCHMNYEYNLKLRVCEKKKNLNW